MFETFLKILGSIEGRRSEKGTVGHRSQCVFITDVQVCMYTSMLNPLKLYPCCLNLFTVAVSLCLLPSLPVVIVNVIVTVGRNIFVACLFLLIVSSVEQASQTFHICPIIHVRYNFRKFNDFVGFPMLVASTVGNASLLPLTFYRDICACVLRHTCWTLY